MSDPAVKKHTVELPPAGDARREELKRRDDALAAEAEAASATVGAIDPAKLEIDNEIAVEIVEHNALSVSGAQLGKRYCWVRAFSKDGRADMQPVMAKQSIRVRLRGSSDLIPAWEVILDGPESRENIDVHGYRRIGDCILMRCDEAVYRALADDERRRADEFAGKYQASLEDMVTHSKLASALIGIHDTGGLSGRDYARARREFARQGALHVFERMLRQGDVPNLTPAQAAGR